MQGCLMKNQTLSAVGFPAKTSVRPIIEARELMGSAVDYGPNSLGSFASYDRDTFSLKTSQQSLFGDSIACLAILPRAGSMRNGRLFRRTCWERRTKEREFSLWPTP